MKLFASLRLGASSLLCIFFPAFLTAAHAEPTAAGNGNGALSESADEIGNEIDDLDTQRRAVAPYGPLTPVFDTWGDFWILLDDSIGLNMGFAYTSLVQAATNGDYAGPREGASGDFDMFGRWYAFREGVNKGILNEGVLGFNTEYRHRYTDAPPSELGDSIGSLWGTTSGFSEQDFSLIEWWWQQRMFDDKFALRAGKLDLANLFDVYRFNSANHFYQNAAFSDNPTIPFPQNGLGFSIQWEPTDEVFLRYGFGDGEGRKTETARTSLNRIDSWFSIATAGWFGDVGDLGKGLYQVTGWVSDKRTGSELPQAHGWSIVAQQELPNGWVPYARYAWSSDAAVDTRQLFTAGAVLEEPFGREFDRFGWAAGWGQPHERSTFRDQWVGEIFYRWAITSKIRLTPHAQIIIDPSRNPNDNTIGIFGLRSRITF